MLCVVYQQIEQKVKQINLQLFGNKKILFCSPVVGNETTNISLSRKICSKKCCVWPKNVKSFCRYWQEKFFGFTLMFFRVLEKIIILAHLTFLHNDKLFEFYRFYKRKYIVVLFILFSYSASMCVQQRYGIIFYCI